MACLGGAFADDSAPLASIDSTPVEWATVGAFGQPAVASSTLTRGLHMSSSSLFSPLRVGRHELSHRVVMAPLTRMRAGRPGNVPHDLNATYYEQRASSGGLIIAEASQVTPFGQGVPASPGIHSDAQIAGWRLVTDAVHKKGGLIFLQLWHVGRMSHSSLQPNGELPVAPSAIRPAGEAMTADFGSAPFETPRALATEEIPTLVESFAQAARNAHAAGFDGVEIHGANGYLLEQFLHSRSNQRTDAYGGTIENRARLLLEVTQAASDVFGEDRVGVRLSPYGKAGDCGDPDPLPLYRYTIRELAKHGLAYLHLIEPRSSGSARAEVDHQDVPSAAALFRPIWPGVLITAGNFTPQTAEHAVNAGHADAIAFGRSFLANPDLPRRLQTGAPLNPYNRATFYGGDEKGYTDYPSLDACVV